MAKACGRTVLLSCLGVALQLAGLVLFVLGFFPVKPALMGRSDVVSAMPSCQTNADLSDEEWSRMSQLSYREASGVGRQFDRLVVMVVDGLPAEFLLGRGDRPPPAELVAAMPFTHSLLATGKAIGYHAKAAPPTVTMPRLKAMTSGAIAGFLDVAFNFNTQALLDDNLIDQLAVAGWKMVMLGDDTWLKLFPDNFMRRDGVHSFYVKDTVEVDRNVTRHLRRELAATDWDLLVLHYLGLDHVGHLGGRSSSLMVPKLKEMDDVIRRIYDKLVRNSSDRRTLLMVASDHGMTEGGNHGGASYQEADALALFISKRYPFSTSGNKIQRTSVSISSTWPSFQVDVVPTLALLLGVPIPKNSVGALLPHLFTSLPPKEQLRALELNAWQLFHQVLVRSSGCLCVRRFCSNASGDSDTGSNRWTAEKDKELEVFCELFKQAIELQSSWRHMENNNFTGKWNEFEVARDAYLKLLKYTAERLARGTTKKNTVLLFCGGALMLLSPIVLFWTLLRLNKAKLRRTQPKADSSSLGDFSFEKLIAVGGVCIHAGSLASSSFVEEEQYTYHFLVSTLSVVCLRHALQHPRQLLHERRVQGGKSLKKDPAEKFAGVNAVRVFAVVVILLCGRLLRAWHRGGVNWTHLPDVAKWLDTVDVQILTALRYAALMVVTASSCLLILTCQHLLRKLLACCLCLSATLIFVYVDSDSGQVPTLFGSTSYPDQAPTLLARLVFGILGTTAALAVTLLPWIEPLGGKTKVEDFPVETGIISALQSTGRVLVSCWCLLQLLLQQSVNAGPIALLLIQLLAAIVFFRQRGNVHGLWFQVLALQWMGGSGHFGLGNSNTLATVDVAGAYIGLSSHSTVLSGLIAFAITYASPFLFLIGRLLLSSPPPSTDRLQVFKGIGLSEVWLLETLAVPCILPMALNGVILVAFTVVLTLMQNHLFVWSVFSPKYLYVCAATACTSIGALFHVIISTYCTCIILLRLHHLAHEQPKPQSNEKIPKVIQFV